MHNSVHLIMTTTWGQQFDIVLDIYDDQYYKLKNNDGYSRFTAEDWNTRYDRNLEH